MIGTPLVVDFADGLHLIKFLNESIGDFAALILRLGKFGRDVYRRFAVKGGIDAIVDERRSQCDLAAGVASGRRESRPISGQHRRCWHVADRIARVRASLGALIATEEE